MSAPTAPRASRRLSACRAASLLALMLAGPCAAQTFTPPLNVSQSASGSYLPSLTLDRGGPSAGALRLFWHDFTSAPNRIWWAEDSTGTWSAAAPCPPVAGQSWSPRAASDPMGVTHVAWRERVAGQDEIFHSTFDGLAWSAAENISATPGMSRNPVIALDPWDRPHVLWEEDPGTGVRFYETHFDGASWSTAADTGLTFVAAAFLDTLRIACDGAGTLHATWQDGTTSVTEVYHAARPDGGAWSRAENVSATPSSFSVEPAIAVGRDDVVHVAWVEQDGATGAFSEICMASLPAGGAWTPRQEITQLRQDAFHPVLAVGADDVPRIAFGSGPFGAREVLFLESPSASPVDVSVSAGVDSDRASLLLDELDQPWIAWQEGSPPTPEIHVAGPGGAPSPPVLLRVARGGRDALLSWTGGAAPFRVGRSETCSAARPWPELTPPGGIGPAAWTDAAVIGDGRLLFYVVE